MTDMLEELTKVNPAHLNKQTKELFYCIMNVIDERDKYKALYENKKSHTDTLEKISEENKKLKEQRETLKEWLKEEINIIKHNYSKVKDEYIMYHAIEPYEKILVKLND